jgi:hypothetical protein
VLSEGVGDGLGEALSLAATSVGVGTGGIPRVGCPAGVVTAAVGWGAVVVGRGAGVGDDPVESGRVTSGQ